MTIIRRLINIIINRNKSVFPSTGREQSCSINRLPFLIKTIRDLKSRKNSISKTKPAKVEGSKY